MKSYSHPFSRSYLVFFPAALVFFSFFYFLGGYGLLDNNEGLYAQIAREMLETGDFILPRLNGGLYLEKPPLLYWLTALSFNFWGINEFAARFFPTLSGLGTLFLMAYFLKKQGRKHSGLLSFFILGTSFGYLAFSRTIIFDVLFTFCLTGALLYLFRFSKDRNYKNALLFYTFLSLAVLAKGFVAIVLTGLIWVTYFLVERRRKKNQLSFWTPLHVGGITCFLVLTLPWHLLASLNEPSFAWFYFINEHVYRFLGIREPYDYYGGSVFYYTYRLLLYFIPWVFVIPLLIKDLFRGNKVIRSQKPFASSPEKDSLPIYLLCWFGCIFLFFSLSKAKANYYLVTAMPPLAILMAFLLDFKKSDRFQKKLFYSGQGLIFVLTVAFLSLFLLKDHFILTLLPVKLLKVLWIPACFGASFILFCQVYQRLQGILWPHLPLGSFCSLLFVASSCVLPFYEETLTQKQAVENSIKILDQTGNLRPETFALYREYENVSSLGFYLPSHLKIVDSISQDLFFAQSQDVSGKTFITSGDFKEKGGYIFVRRNRQRKFLTLFPEAKLIWDSQATFIDRNSLSLKPGKLLLYFVKPFLFSS